MSVRVPYKRQEPVGKGEQDTFAFGLEILHLDIPAKKYLKGLVHPKMKILSVFTHSHVVPTP